MTVPAAFADHCPVGGSDEACIAGQGDGFEALLDGNQDGSSDPVQSLPGRDSSSPLRRQTKLVPTCDGNDATTDVGLCPAAVETCPTRGDVRFWAYSRVVDLSDRTTDPPFVRVLNPDSVCLGPDDPRVDPTAAIPALVEREFKRVVVLKGVAKVNPSPETLVNFQTRFTTAAPASYDIPLTLLGQSVVITATATSWTWHFGDQTQEHSTQSSRAVHNYAATGELQAYVVIEWSGTYRIGADPAARQVTGTATTTGEPVQVLVRQARAELVDQP